MPHLSIIIPAYNEESRIGATLEGTFSYLDRQDYSCEVIVVNDGSTDLTAQKVIDFQPRSAGRLRLIENPGNRGKGYSVRNGMLKAEGEILLFFDADLATPTSEIEKVLKPLEEGRFDIVFGSRALDRSLIGTHQSAFRETIGRIGNLVQFIFTGLRFKDTQCGFKAFRREAARAIFPLQTIDGFGFDPEILFIGRKQGWRMLETPVRWNHVEGSKVHAIGTPLKALLEVMMIRWNNIKGKYER
ncbi:MAG: glycosyltransferase family 2 protein [Acidobacteria bacterium]|nr:glycosyltransferase family 2 protein [Acidobacteriota bacterium]